MYNDTVTSCFDAFAAPAAAVGKGAAVTLFCGSNSVVASITIVTSLLFLSLDVASFFPIYHRRCHLLLLRRSWFLLSLCCFLLLCFVLPLFLSLSLSLPPSLLFVLSAVTVTASISSELLACFFLADV
ncbi:hypothetical protein AAHE18_12G041400 [Arachis hypogaea]